ncbi:MAG: sensor histidine kinase [Microcoleaceae cyanobacterium]
MVQADIIIIDLPNSIDCESSLYDLHLEDHLSLPVIYLVDFLKINPLYLPQLKDSCLYLSQPIHSRELDLAIQLIQQQQKVKALQINEDRFRSIIETINEIIWEVDCNLVFTYISPRIKDILGYEPTEAVGQYCLDLLVPKRQEDIAALITTFLEMKQPIASLEHLCVHKENHYLLVETSAIPMFDYTGEFQGYRGTTRDITERQRIQEALLRSAATNRALINAIPDLILRIDREGTFVNYKAASHQNLQFLPEDFLGKKVAEVLPLELTEPTLKAVAAALKTGQLQTFEYQLMINGELKFWESRIFMSADEEVMVLVRDISDRKQVEEELRTSLLEKELLVREVHHRVKNNLQVISSIFSLQSQTTDDPELLSVLDESQDRIRSMALIHEQLYQSNSLARINFEEYIKSLTQNLRYSYNTKFKTMSFQLEIEPIVLNLDTAIPCGLLINELVSNALKHGFLPRQSGEIGIKLFTIDSEKNKLCLVVQDNGMGLPKQFDINCTSSLGLRLVRALTRQLKGELEMYNQNGAVFKITFFKLD